MTQSRPADIKPTYAEVAKTAPEDLSDLFGRDDDIELDDGDWEDEEGALDEKVQRHSLTAVGASSGRATPSTRKRRMGIRANPTRDNRSAGRVNRRAKPIIVQEDIVNGTLRGVVFAAKYALSVFNTAIHLLRIPLSILLFLWILAYLMSGISNTLHTALRPLCYFPGFHRMPVCLPPPATNRSAGRPTKRPDYPGLIDVQSKTFEQLMGGTSGGSALSLEIKRAEMATSDLVALVRVSDLKAKGSLAESLTGFVDDAKKTGRGLQKLSAKVGGAVDNIMAVNDYALSSIEDARAKQPTSFIGSLMPWSPSAKDIEAIVIKTFDEAMDVLSKNMNRLIVEAENNLHNLHDLEERLATIHDIITREDNAIKVDKDELLSLLWTKLGMNQKKLKNFDDHLALLGAMSVYRKDAQAHVVAALQTLNAMSDDMEDLRERVSAPELVGSETIPIEVHMKSIRMGLERMKEGRLKARRLEEDTVKRVLGVNKLDTDDDEDNA